MIGNGVRKTLAAVTNSDSVIFAGVGGGVGGQLPKKKGIMMRCLRLSFHFLFFFQTFLVLSRQPSIT